MTRDRNRYRWTVLAVGTGAQTVMWFGVFVPPVLAPVVEDRYSLGLTSLGLAIGSTTAGMTLTLFGWGLLVDRIGERLVFFLGLGTAAAALGAAGFTTSFAWFMVWMFLFGAAGASATSASTRAIVGWFPPGKRGLAFSIRQGSLPVGALLSAIVLPPLHDLAGFRGTFLVLAAACAAATVAAVFSLGAEPPHTWSAPLIDERALRPLRDPTLWRLSGAATLLVSPQMAISSLAVVYFHEERGFSLVDAAYVLAGIRVFGLAAQIAAGAWADRRGDLLHPLRMLSLLFAATLAVAVLATGASAGLTAAGWILAGGAALGWNGLSYAVVAEVAGYSRSGAALGLQQSVLGAACFVTPLVFAVIVQATSWQAALAVFAALPLGAYLLYGPVQRQLSVRPVVESS